MKFESWNKEEQFEVLRHPESICVVTTTRYPKFGSAEDSDAARVDNVRGALAIETFLRALEKGYAVEVSDSGSSPEFLAQLRELGVNVMEHNKEKRAERKRILYRNVQSNAEVKTVVWIEPEKVDMISDECMASCVAPIINDEADVVIPSRTEKSWESYPGYMRKSEDIANRKSNDMLRREGLLTPDQPDLDLFFGPRVFANKPEIHAIFAEEYALDTDHTKAISARLDPDGYSNSFNFAVARALQEHHRVISVPTDYQYSESQRNIEMQQASNFELYRRAQRINIVGGLMSLFRLRKGKWSIMKEAK